MTTAITRHQPQQGLMATNVSELETLGKICAASGFFLDSKEAAQAMVKIAAGQELGLQPIQAMTGINVIKGRVTLSANLMAALLKRAGYRMKVTWQGNTACTITVWDAQGHECGDSSFSMDDAKAAGLSGDGWRKYPRNMLYARAVSNAARWYAPEVLTGCYLPEELEEIETPKARHIEPRTTTALPQTIEQPDDYTEAETISELVDADSEHDRARKAFFAEAGKKGLNDDQQRALLGVTSRKDAATERFRECTTALKEWGQKEREIVMACLEAPTVQEMRDLYRSLPDITRDLITPSCQLRSRSITGATFGGES